MSTAKPLLLLDVDGVLNPWPLITRKGHRAGDDYTRHDFTDVPGFPNGLPVLLAASHGQALRDLSEVYTLIWATTWMEEANRLLSPLLGLPDDIPVITWPTHALESHRTEGRNGSWKTAWAARWLDDYAPGLPWAWVDDEVNRYDRLWFGRWYETHTPVPHLLLRISEHRGLASDDFQALRDFATSVT